MTHYRALGVPHTATATEIRSAYLRLARELHPDRTGGDKAKEERFKEVTAAYEVLSDPDRRSVYDRKMSCTAWTMIDLEVLFKTMAGASRAEAQAAERWRRRLVLGTYWRGRIEEALDSCRERDLVGILEELLACPPSTSP